MRAAIFLTLMSTSAMAQGLRASDTELDLAGLTEALTGQAIEFYDGSKSYYFSGGSYMYTYVDGGEEWTGTYTLAPQGKVCVQLELSGSRCDTYVLTGDRLVLIIEDGTRFPARARVAME